MSESGRDRYRLLLVDDDDVFLEDVRLLLERRFDCVCETDPDAVVAVASRAHPDAVLLDLDFDGVMLGFEILEKLRVAYPDLPVFLWTEAPPSDVEERGRLLGASGMLSKTAPPAVIAAAIAAV